MVALQMGWLRRAVICVTLASCLVECRPRSTSNEVIDLGYARYKGTPLQAGVTQWLGIQFAAPPVGELRWRKPQNPPYTQGVQDADAFKPVCVGLSGMPLGQGAEEDCLYLDVFAPSNATAESKLPVWFFIQGGGYAGDTDENFNATEVIQNSGYNMVFVQINYRVGAFGFLAGAQVLWDGDLNVGLLDQRKALEWTQKYIHLFGGDPNHVVIHGDSAGAGSVAYQLTAYGGFGESLFVGAIAESPFLPTYRTIGEMQFQFDNFTSVLNCSHTFNPMGCLRKLDSAILQSADVVSNFPGTSKSILPDWFWLPVVDGTFSPDLLYNLFEEGRFKRVPLMVGDDTDEGTSFVSSGVNSSATFGEYLKANYPHLSSRNIQRIMDTYPSPGKQFLFQNAWFGPAEQAYGEATLICPGIEMTTAYAQHVSPAQSWNYRYNVAGFGAAFAGVYHVAEKPAIFGPGNAGTCEPGCSYETYNKNIVPVVMHYWISFIRALNPNTYKYEGAPMWEPWSSGSGAQRLKIQTNATEMEQVPSDELARCAMWKSMAHNTEQ